MRRVVIDMLLKLHETQWEKEGENDTTYSDCYLLNNSYEKNLKEGKPQ
jgi:hypothetical protein